MNVAGSACNETTELPTRVQALVKGSRGYDDQMSDPSKASAKSTQTSVIGVLYLILGIGFVAIDRRTGSQA